MGTIMPPRTRLGNPAFAQGRRMAPGMAMRGNAMRQMPPGAMRRGGLIGRPGRQLAMRRELNKPKHLLGQSEAQSVPQNRGWAGVPVIGGWVEMLLGIIFRGQEYREVQRRSAVGDWIKRRTLSPREEMAVAARRRAERRRMMPTASARAARPRGTAAPGTMRGRAQPSVLLRGARGR